MNNGMNDFAEVSKKLDTNLKIISLDYQNNYVEHLTLNQQTKIVHVRAKSTCVYNLFFVYIKKLFKKLIFSKLFWLTCKVEGLKITT